MRATLLVGVVVAFSVLIPLSYPNAGASGALAEGGSVIRGDVNDDGEVNSIDAFLLLQFNAGIIWPDPNAERYKVADLNGDGVINAFDSLLILQFHAGLLSSLPAGVANAQFETSSYTVEIESIESVVGQEGVADLRIADITGRGIGAWTIDVATTLPSSR